MNKLYFLHRFISIVIQITRISTNENEQTTTKTFVHSSVRAHFKAVYTVFSTFDDRPHALREFEPTHSYLHHHHYRLVLSSLMNDKPHVGSAHWI